MFDSVIPADDTIDNKNASRIYNRRAAYFITVQFLLLPVQKSKPISQRGPNLWLQFVPSSSNWAIRTGEHIRSKSYRYRDIYKYTTNALRVFCNFLIHQFSYALTLFQTLCNIVWHICNDFLLCAFYARFHLHLFGLRCLFFGSAFLPFFSILFSASRSSLHQFYQF